MHILNQDLEFFEENRTCSYFNNEVSDIRYRFINNCSIEDYQKNLNEVGEDLEKSILYQNVKIVQNVFL